MPGLTGESVELVFEMLFVSHRFQRGHRIRFTITGATPDRCNSRAIARGRGRAVRRPRSETRRIDPDRASVAGGHRGPDDAAASVGLPRRLESDVLLEQTREGLQRVELS